MAVVKYEANVEQNNVLEKIVFETEGNPVEYLWSRFGMSTYIEYVRPVEEALEE